MPAISGRRPAHGPPVQAGTTDDQGISVASASRRAGCGSCGVDHCASRHDGRPDLSPYRSYLVIW